MLGLFLTFESSFNLKDVGERQSGQGGVEMKSGRRIRDDVSEEYPSVVQLRSTTTDPLVSQPSHYYY